LLGTTAEVDGEDIDGWWWQSTEAQAAKWVVAQWGDPIYQELVIVFNWVTGP
jgi:hypothetical protein